ncbi:SH3 domain-containing protein [Winogradskyella sp. 3972H.M.0a.05]|uniref:SH3 domain-containing protein n=1 Tax=Winogradskyella sp. 3972H.M.0a.05 TaxID=2950277 RepID=UPI0033968078
MFLRILVVACFALSVAQAQDIQYVFAENGLVVREKPNQGAIKVGLLDYGTPVEIIEHTNLMLDIKDKNEKVTGEWVKIRGIDAYEHFEEGYVFNGFLTEKKIERPLKVKFEAFTVFVDEMKRDTKAIKNSENPDSKAFEVKLGKSPEGRYIKVKHHQGYRTIQVFQRHQNRLTLVNGKTECDLKEYDQYNSSWKPLKMLPRSNNIFKTLVFDKEDYKRFSEVDMKELKTYVKEHCGEDWSKLIETSKSIEDKVIKVNASQIQLRVLMTDIDGYKTEKIISFELPAEN